MDTSRLVVDTGPWIFGRKVVLPAGTVARIDDAEKKVYVDLTKDQIKDSPAWDDAANGEDDIFRDSLGRYYGELYR